MISKTTTCKTHEPKHLGLLVDSSMLNLLDCLQSNTRPTEVSTLEVATCVLQNCPLDTDECAAQTEKPMKIKDARPQLD